MAGDVMLTEVGADAIVRMIRDNLAYFKFGEGGFVLSPNEVIETVEASASGTENTYDHTIAGGDFEIIGVNQVSKLFSLDGDHSDSLPVGVQVVIEGSTDNNGRYTVVSVTPGDPTVVEVNEAIPSATIDGTMYVDHLPIARYYSGGGAIYHAMVVEEIIPGPDTVVQTMQDVDGEGNLSGAGGTGTINYKTGALHVEFTSNVGAGNQVRTRFKYHDQRQSALSIGEPLEDLVAEGSPLADDGDPSLFSYQKSFGGGTPPDTSAVITDRGDGYATIRCTVRLREHEGIDDGRAGSWGGVPFYFEVGVFTVAGIMVAYATHDKTRHTGGNLIEHTIDFVI